jgi:hypothetical protein
VLSDIHCAIGHPLCYRTFTVLSDIHCAIGHSQCYRTFTVLSDIHCAIGHSLLSDIHCTIGHSQCYRTFTVLSDIHSAIGHSQCYRTFTVLSDIRLNTNLPVQISKFIQFVPPHAPTTHSPPLCLNFRQLYLYFRTSSTRRTSGEQKENLQTRTFSLFL